MIITIDGPAASGKSTTARELAQQLHFFYVNSGLLYRGLSWLILTHFTLDDLLTLSHEKINELKEQLTYQEKDGKASLIWEKENITPLLKNPQIDRAASLLGMNEHAREIVFKWQKELVCQHPNSIIEGRDAGSLVFPHADYKFFLTAQPEIRAERWHKDQRAKGNEFSLKEALQFVKDRDERDTKRRIAPLQVPEGALIIDNSEMNLKETINRLRKIIVQ